MIQETRHNSSRQELLFIYLLCPLLLSGCLTAPFLPYDDFIHVSFPVVLGTEPWYAAFSLDALAAQSATYFPVTLLSYRAEHFIACDVCNVRNWAPLVRLDNLAIHMLTGLFLWLICESFALKRISRVFVTAAFLLHPMACESVCWVSERKNLLAGVFGFAAIVVLLRCKDYRWRVIWANLLYTLALFGKPSALGLLPVILVLEIWHYLGGKTEIPNVRSEGWWPLLGCVGFILIAMFDLALSLVAGNRVLMPLPGGSHYTAILTDFEILQRYLENLLVPAHLSVFYFVKPIISFTEVRCLLSVLFLVIVFSVSVLFSERRGLCIFFWFWFISALGPVLNLFGFPYLMQDRYAYLSAPAIFIVVSLALEGLAARFIKHEHLDSLRLQRLGLACVGIISIGYALTAASRSVLWENTYVLFQDAVRKQPKSAIAQVYMGTTLAKIADWDEEHHNERSPESDRVKAVQHLETACMLDDFVRLIRPGQPYAALAYVELKLGKLDEAERAARRCLAGKFHIPVDNLTLMEMHVRLAEILFARQRFDEAVAEADSALNIIKNSQDAYLIKSRALDSLNRPDEAAAARRQGGIRVPPAH